MADRMSWMILIISGVFGMLVGSFLNVCCYRLPRNMGIAQPPSACGACGTRLRWHENLPLWGWLGSGGRCRHCGARFSIMYMLAELVVGTLSALACWYAFVGMPPMMSEQLFHWGVILGWPPVVLQALVASLLLIVIWWLYVVSMIDVQHQIIPDELIVPFQVMIPLLVVVLPLGFGGAWAPHAWFWAGRS